MLLRLSSLCLAYALSRTAFAQQQSSTTASEHIVIIDHSQQSNANISEVLSRVGLYEGHPSVRRVFNNSAFTGFAAKLQPCHADDLVNMTDISLVEKSAKILHTGVIKRQASYASETRPDAPWGLERLSTVFFHGTDAESMDYTYTFANAELGRGVDIYVIDSGIWTEHHGFGGRASMLWAFDGNFNDTDGHGTHVAGTAAAADFGVASNANVFGIRVLDDQGKGSTATVIAGIDYVVQQHDQRKREVPDFKGSVISISLAAAGEVAALDEAIRAAVNAGVHACVAAGNEGDDACKGSPASSGGIEGPAITVGSIDIDGQRSDFSNHGDCVDVYAPGLDILSAGLEDPMLLAFMSGTSQATPHVTGLVAYAMANKTLADDTGLMKQWIKSMALPMADGNSMANNGASDGTVDGMLGFNKAAAGWSVRTKRETRISRRSSDQFQPGISQLESDVAMI